MLYEVITQQFKPGRYEGAGKDLNVGYFVGCGVDIITRNTGSASLDVLKKMSKAVTILDNCCCGLPAQSYGDIEAARKIAGKNLEILCAEEYDVIVTDYNLCRLFDIETDDAVRVESRQEEKHNA